MEIAVSYQLGIPHSEFLRWDQDDRDKAVWHYLRERDRCGTCGTRRAEWDEKRGGNRRAYVAELERCPGCEQLEAAHAALAADRRKGVVGRGVHVVLRPNPALKKRGVSGGR